MQKFVARESFEFSNGAIGWRPGGPFDCLGPYAKVQNCPVQGYHGRLTCYATGYADTAFSVPACTRFHGRYVGGFFTHADDGGIIFRPYDRFADIFRVNHPTRETRVIHEMAEYSRQSGGSVDIDRAFGTVSIEWKGGQCFMQGDDASQFESEVDALCRKYPSLWGETAALALAKPYIECLGE